MVDLVLLGAGASYGSNDVSPYPPPLGNGPAGLFARLEEASILAAGLPASLKQTFRENFERGMSEYYELADGDVMQFQRELGAYMARFAPGPKNEYALLLQQLSPRRVIFSTLNYDLLIELSARSVGLPTTYEMQTNTGRLRLLKPHGSCNFWPDTSGNIFKGLRVARGGRSDVEANIVMLDETETRKRCAEDDSFAPAIAMYAEGKPVRVCPSFVQDQQRQWRQAALQANRVFVSGVRVHRADAHIWQTLSESPAPVVYFGLGSDREEFFSWREKCKKRRAYFIEGDFSFARKAMCARLE